jgi:glycosyltransferase involved in cell wall biosynthesis
MRIAQLKTRAAHGGAETLLLHLTEELAQRGHDVLTIVGESGWLETELGKRGLPRRHIPMLSIRDGVCSLPTLRTEIRAFRADVVLSHGARVNLWGTLVAQVLRLPSVSVEHNVDLWRQNSHLRRGIDKQVARYNAHRIAVSEAVAGVLCSTGTLSRKRITVVPNAVRSQRSIATRDEIRRNFGLQSNHFVFVTVARLTEQKGHRHLIEAFGRICEQLPTARLLLIGEGGLREELTSLAGECGVGSRTIFAGAINGVASFLSAFDVFVLPSLWEGMPLAVLEAMSAGLPVIATRVAGTPEIVEDGITGLLVDPAQPRQLANAMTTLFHSPAMRQHLARVAMDYVTNNHSMVSLCASYEEVLRRVTANGGHVG